jgi:tetratricopeptide (TPR) repeat protein
MNPAVVTIATSTRGGFTPLEWKYLGEELCARLRGGASAGFEALRSGADAEQGGDLDRAQARYQEAIRLLPASAGARYRLARLHLRRGDDDAARRTFGDVMERDSSYRAIDSEGRRWHAAGHAAAAARGYRNILRMDPENPYAELGLAQLAAASGDHCAAIAHFSRALQCCGTLIDAHRGIARSLEATGAIGRAAQHYARSLRLELCGHAPLDAPIATRTRAPRVFDAAHWDIHRRLASLQHESDWLLALDRLHT